jgi:hypothetical protein
MELLIIVKLIIITLLINTSFIEKYQYLIDYPLPYEIIGYETQYDLFRKLVRTHDMKDIIPFIQTKIYLHYFIYNDNNIYYRELDNNLEKYFKITKIDVKNRSIDYITSYIQKYIEHYNLKSTKTDFPKEYILKNLYELKDIVNNIKSEDIDKIIENFRKIDQFSPLNIHSSFLHKIIYDKSKETNYLKLKDLYTNYNKWYKESYPEDKKLKNKINKNQLEKLVEEHIKNKKWSMNEKHIHQKINGKFIKCWKYIYFQQ